MPRDGPAPKRILIVEDDYLIARDLEEQLMDAGFVVIGPASTVSDAMTSIETGLPDLAVLDVNLGDETSYAVADALVKMGVRFLFTTGYGPEAIAPQYRSNLILTKPYALNEVIALIRDLL